MAVREFDGVDDRIEFAGPGTDICNGAYSIVALVEPMVLDSSKMYVALRSGGALVGSLGESGLGTLACFTASAFSNTAFVHFTEDVWNLAAVTKAAGSVPTRFHQKVLGSGSWAHGNGGDPIDNQPGNVDSVIVGSNVSNPKNFRGAVVAIFDFELSDADVEAIQTLSTSQFLADLGAVQLLQFNQASVGTAVLDLIADGDQTAITGTTVVTGDDPAWTYGATVIPPLLCSLHLSGGVANSDPTASIGGAESNVAPNAALFDDVSNPDRVAGVTDYRLIYIHNDDVADGDVVAYVSTQLESGRQIAIGVPTEAAGSTVSAIANDTTAPSGVTFSAPTTAPTGISLGVIPAGSKRGLWMRRTINSSTPVDPTNFATVKIEVSRTS